MPSLVHHVIWPGMLGLACLLIHPPRNYKLCKSETTLLQQFIAFSACDLLPVVLEILRSWSLQLATSSRLGLRDGRCWSRFARILVQSCGRDGWGQALRPQGQAISRWPPTAALPQGVSVFQGNLVPCCSSWSGQVVSLVYVAYSLIIWFFLDICIWYDHRWDYSLIIP